MTSRKTLALRQFVATGFALLALLFIVGKCTGCNVTPKQAGDATEAGCALVQAFTADHVVDSICATAPELAQLAAAAMASRADSGARTVVACKIIPTTTTCASNAETLAGIRAVRAAR